MRHLIFWQDIPSMHQVPLLREVASISSAEVCWVVEREISERRRKQGWTSIKPHNVRLIANPSADKVRAILARQPNESVHVFSGYSHPFVRSVIKRTHSLATLNIAIMAESNRAQGAIAYLNQLRGFWLTRELKTHSAAVFAIGHLGMNWYRRLGFPEDVLFPFGYFVDSTTVSIEREREGVENDGTRFLFVGQHIDRKGGDLLLRALSKVESSKPWRLEFIGDGPRRSGWMDLARQLKLADHVEFLGVISNEELHLRLPQYDCLILPSRWDGWGAVTNEALQAGIKVVCSDSCGSSILLNDPRRGSVFRTNSVMSLTMALENQIHQGPLSNLQRQEIHGWSQRISARATAAYFCDVLDYAFGTAKTDRTTPIPPWYS